MKTISSGRTISMNKYIVIGDKVPKDMILPLVIDITDFEKLIEGIVSKIDESKTIEIRASDISKGIFKVNVIDKEAKE